MIILNENTTNKVCLNLTISLTLPKFLFIVKSKTTNIENKCILTNISTKTERYYLFNLITKTSANPLNGELDLGKNGDEYDYHIYEQSSATNLDPTNAILLGNGIMTYKYDMNLNRAKMNNGATTRKTFNN